MKTIAVKVSDSTYRWLAALAAANSQLPPEALLSVVAEPIADYAGRRPPGSWQFDVVEPLLKGTGFQNRLSCAQDQDCNKADARDARKLRPAEIAFAGEPAPQS